VDLTQSDLSLAGNRPVPPTDAGTQLHTYTYQQYPYMSLPIYRLRLAGRIVSRPSCPNGCTLDGRDGVGNALVRRHQRLDHLSADVRQPLVPLHHGISSAVEFVESRSKSENHLRNDLPPVGDPCVDSILTGMATLRFWSVAWPPQASQATRTACISWLQPSTRLVDSLAAIHAR
jgi:hypothetical protein